jgi:hypothetical protein
MILKSHSRRTESYGQLIGYLTRDGAVARGADQEPILFRHNVFGASNAEIVEEFKANERNRLNHRANNIRLYHDIISWRAADAERLTDDTIARIAGKYAELRNDSALYAGAIHRNSQHTHLHLMISAVEAFSGKSIRISKAEFQEIKQELQNYEQERFGLIQSGVEHGKGSGEKGDKEYHLEERTGKISRKEEVRLILEESFAEAMNKDAFFENAKNNGLELYERSGRISGVDDNGRHYRFGNLGFDEVKMQELGIREERLADIESLMESRNRERSVEVGDEFNEGQVKEDELKDRIKDEDKDIKEF